MKKHFDFAIIGQGIAGTLLHFLLTQRQLIGLVIDKGHDAASSKVASGLINPITGRKYVRSWMYDELKSEVDKVYKGLERQLTINILNEHQIVRVLSSIKEENLWYEKSIQDGYDKYFVQDVDSDDYKDLINEATSFGEVKEGAKLDMKELIVAYRSHLQESQSLSEAEFDYSKLTQDDDHKWHYADFTFDKVVFCEGWQLRNNPFFSHLGHEAAKGEVLIIKLKNKKLLQSIKKRVFITPLRDNLYWVGSTFEWDFDDHLPTVAKRSYLIQALDDMIGGAYEIVDQWAGVRPTTKDRRPLLGSHPQFSNLYIFNGLGTKGASLGPYWAQQMAAYILDDKPLPMEVDISRFS